MLAYFSSISGLAALNVIITQFLNSKFNINKTISKQIISWITPILVAVLGLVFGLGIFADFGTITEWSAWVYTILTGFGSALISNGIYDIKDIQSFQELIEKIKTLKINK